MLCDPMPCLIPGTPPLTCCSADQIIKLDSSLKVPISFLNRCPACKRNFIDLYCYFTCDPHQSQFMNANKTKSQGKDTAITAVNCAVSTDFAVGMYNSCRDVQMPSGNMKALSVLCGQGQGKCSPQHWLDYMGNTSNGQTPFTINFHIADKPVHIGNATLDPMTRNITPCTASCSCQDCAAVCAAPPPAAPRVQPWTIIGIDAMVLICSCVFFMFVFTFGTYLIWYVWGETEFCCYSVIWS